MRCDFSVVRALGRCQIWQNPSPVYAPLCWQQTTTNGLFRCQLQKSLCRYCLVHNCLHPERVHYQVGLCVAIPEHSESGNDSDLHEVASTEELLQGYSRLSDTGPHRELEHPSVGSQFKRTVTLLKATERGRSVKDLSTTTFKPQVARCVQNPSSAASM